jgi:hypothetical protein
MRPSCRSEATAQDISRSGRGPVGTTFWAPANVAASGLNDLRPKSSPDRSNGVEDQSQVVASSNRPQCRLLECSRKYFIINDSLRTNEHLGCDFMHPSKQDVDIPNETRRKDVPLVSPGEFDIKGCS